VEVAVKCRFVLVLLAVSFMAATAWSQCNNPTDPGVVICTPTNGSTVVATPEISIRSTPAQGASITQFKLYDNNVDIFDGPPGDSGVNLYDGAIYNGYHNFVVNAWDSDGHLYQARTSVTVTGLAFSPCAMPKSPGINFCAPPSNAVLPVNPTVYAAATGTSPIRSINFYVNGVLAQTVPNSVPNGNSFGVGVSVQLPKQGVAYTVRASASDTSGHTYTATKSITGKYTYSAYSCAPKGNQCYPGINVISPQDEAYVGSRFNLDAQIIQAPKPIAAMRAYLDNTVVATSDNAALQHEITTSLDGTHILTIQGWDEDGIEYRVQQNININVKE
jgi:hypothetical protein